MYPLALCLLPLFSEADIAHFNRIPAASPVTYCTRTQSVRGAATWLMPLSPTTSFDISLAEWGRRVMAIAHDGNAGPDGTA